MKGNFVNDTNLNELLSLKKKYENKIEEKKANVN
jgi:hypothetical protein